MWLLTYYFLVIMGRFTAALRGVPPHLVRLIKSSLSEKITIFVYMFYYIPRMWSIAYEGGLQIQ